MRLLASRVARRRELVLLLAREGVLLRAEISVDAHRLSLPRIREAIPSHAVDHFLVAVLEASARPGHAGDVVRHVAHGLHAARHDGVCLAGKNALGGQGDCLHARSADLVHCGAAHRGRQACPHGRLPRRRLAHSSAEDVAHDAFLHILSGNICCFQGGLNGRRAQLGGDNIHQGASNSADGSSFAAEDKDLWLCGGEALR
mmetsp:Transcript_50457/g.108768  ORF Transcript_50457/g.108768 Transcript_50457/m.108768 type:complete len:201 (-) Transcript_50457:159-761(-)